jgi:uncharacterized integral membrane protein
VRRSAIGAAEKGKDGATAKGTVTTRDNGASRQEGRAMANGAQGAQSKGNNGFLIGGGILLVLLLIFIFQNTADTQFKFLFWSFTLPLWLVLVITALVAFVILMWRRHKRRQARRDGR